MVNDVIKEKYVSGIVGNKNDLYLQTQVNVDEARKYSDEKNIKF